MGKRQITYTIAKNQLSVKDKERIVLRILTANLEKLDMKSLFKLP